PLAASTPAAARGPRGPPAGRRPLALRAWPPADAAGRRLPRAAAARCRAAAGSRSHLLAGEPAGCVAALSALGRSADALRSRESAAVGALFGSPLAHPLCLRRRFRPDAHRLGTERRRDPAAGVEPAADDVPLPRRLERRDPPPPEDVPGTVGGPAGSLRHAASPGGEPASPSALPFRAAGDVSSQPCRRSRRGPRRRLSSEE